MRASMETRFFFFKQKTAYEMRISDWSSDVCSSDLLADTIERLGRGKTDEIDPLLLGVGDFALRAGHVRPVAPVEAFDRIRALATGGAHAIHRGAAAADHDAVLAFGVERAVHDPRNPISQPLAESTDSPSGTDENRKE